ncbi:hypothetical protein M8542_13295 [Amycolatopsis sp. OK19-0408]|uniref:Uncharacterized protein n=1 Tax=Amycolatopsis iheyensis TaxID=2945988 RepID=A0A9X2NA46_9PSEU|nr:hypothetical protein [Amycolatopsis iheyensis]MCR6483793.1 hypothetical protein [Amycolatopsis iheyensis]
MNSDASPVRWRASIGLAVGGGGPVSSIVESEHGSEGSALAWVERKLPRTRFPAWIPAARRADGVELFGRVARGRVVTGRLVPTWESEGTAVWHADRAGDQVQWRRCSAESEES